MRTTGGRGLGTHRSLSGGSVRSVLDASMLWRVLPYDLHQYCVISSGGEKRTGKSLRRSTQDSIRCPRWTRRCAYFDGTIPSVRQYVKY